MPGDWSGGIRVTISISKTKACTDSEAQMKQPAHLYLDPKATQSQSIVGTGAKRNEAKGKDNEGFKMLLKPKRNKTDQVEGE